MNKRILLVGGVFDFSVGRRSGYVEKMYDEMIHYFGVPYIKYLNGGHYETLLDLVNSKNKWDCIIWMPDIDNKHDKVLPFIFQHSNALIIQSKYNGGRYTTPDLINRMDESGADMLIEFNKIDNLIKARLIDKMGSVYCDTFSVVDMTITLTDFIHHRLGYHEPIKGGVIPQEHDAGAF